MHDVGFTFGAKFAGGFYGLFRAECFEVVVITNLGGDKTALKVGVDGAGGFGSGGTFLDGPGTTFFFASCKEGLKT